MRSLFEALEDGRPFLGRFRSDEEMLADDNFVATAEKIRARVRAAAEGDAPADIPEDALFERVVVGAIPLMGADVEIAAVAALVRHYAIVAERGRQP